MSKDSFKEISVYEDGQLQYECTYYVVPHGWEDAYPHRLGTAEEGFVIRVGMSRKFWSSGHVHWEHLNDNNGMFIRACIRYRADGSDIEDTARHPDAPQPTEFQAPVRPIEEWRAMKGVIIKEVLKKHASLTRTAADGL